ncbi:hypothetical protein [Rhizobium rhizoryzae]|nr:hypothetical protein [Rhizobium rhizoryzae]
MAKITMLTLASALLLGGLSLAAKAEPQHLCPRIDGTCDVR